VSASRKFGWLVLMGIFSFAAVEYRLFLSGAQTGLDPPSKQHDENPLTSQSLRVTVVSNHPVFPWCIRAFTICKYGPMYTHYINGAYNIFTGAQRCFDDQFVYIKTVIASIFGKHRKRCNRTCETFVQDDVTLTSVRISVILCLYSGQRKSGKRPMHLPCRLLRAFGVLAACEKPIDAPSSIYKAGRHEILGSFDFPQNYCAMFTKSIWQYSANPQPQHDGVIRWLHRFLSEKPSYYSRKRSSNFREPAHNDRRAYDPYDPVPNTSRESRYERHYEEPFRPRSESRYATLGKRPAYIPPEKNGKGPRCYRTTAKKYSR